MRGRVTYCAVSMLLFHLEICRNHIVDPLMAQMVKSLPAMQETQVRSLGREDLLEKEIATHSSILA